MFFFGGFFFMGGGWIVFYMLFYSCDIILYGGWLDIHSGGNCIYNMWNSLEIIHFCFIYCFYLFLFICILISGWRGFFRWSRKSWGTRGEKWRPYLDGWQLFWDCLQGELLHQILCPLVWSLQKTGTHLGWIGIHVKAIWTSLYS